MQYYTIYDILIARWVNSLRLSDAYMRRYTIIGSDNGLPPGRRKAFI